MGSLVAIGILSVVLLSQNQSGPTGPQPVKVFGRNPPCVTDVTDENPMGMLWDVCPDDAVNPDFTSWRALDDLKRIQDGGSVALPFPEKQGGPRGDVTCWVYYPAGYGNVGTADKPEWGEVTPAHQGQVGPDSDGTCPGMARTYPIPGVRIDP